MGTQREPAPVVELCEVGSLGVRVNGQWHAVRGERTRAALAAMSLHLADGVRTEALIEAVWPSPDRPPTARQSLANLAARLRATFGEQFVTGTGAGYRLGAHVRSDRTRFLDEVDQATALLDHSPVDALHTVSQALDRVRGRPWHDVEFPVEVEADRAKLELQIEAAHRLQARALVVLGRDTDAIPVLEQLVADGPADESCWFELARIRADMGHRVDALRTLRAARDRLGQHGLTLGEAAAELERRLLVGSPETFDIGTEFPTAATPLFGREELVADVVDLMRTNSAVTLLGPAGVGKTRLAIEVAQRLPIDDRHFVDLTPLLDHHSVPSAVAAALDVAVEPGTAPTDALVGDIGDRSLLLVLDNCEQVVRGAAALAAAIGGACPNCTVLATSREHLGSPAERIVRVDPLPCGPSDAGVELFFDRANRLGIQVPAEAWREPAAALCRAIDGLPLAIELAAARTTVLTPSEILATLDERFLVLRSSGGTGLEEAIRWSWDLLDDDEQRALHRLSVFHSGATLDAASSVLGLDRWATLDLAERLSRKSLLTIRQSPNQPSRIELLDSIRYFVLADAERAGTIVACRQAHLSWVDHMTTSYCGEHGYDGPDLSTGWLDAERHEFRAALDYAATDAPAAAIGAQICHRLFGWWRARSATPDGYARLRTLMALADLEPADRCGPAASLASLARIAAVPDDEVARLVEDARRVLTHAPPSADRDQAELRLIEAAFDDRDSELGPRLRRIATSGGEIGVTAQHLLSAWTITNEPERAGAVAADFAATALPFGGACLSHAREFEGLAAVVAGEWTAAGSRLGTAIDAHLVDGQIFCAIHCCEGVAWLAIEAGDIDTGRALLANTEALRLTHRRSRAGFEQQAIAGALRHLGALPVPASGADLEETIDWAREVAAHISNSNARTPE